MLWQKVQFVILVDYKILDRTAGPTLWLIGLRVTSRRTLGAHTSRLDPIPHAGSVLGAPSRAIDRCHFVCVEYLT